MNRIIFIGMFLSFNLLAANVQLNINTKFTKESDHKTIATESSVKHKLGEEWEIPFQNDKNLSLKMKVSKVANEKDSVLLEAKIVEMVEGKENILSSPRIITQIGKEAKISMNDEKMGQFLDVSLIPAKLTK